MRGSVFGFWKLREQLQYFRIYVRVDLSRRQRLGPVRVMRNESCGMIPAEMPDQLTQQYENSIGHRFGRLDAGDEGSLLSLPLAPGAPKHHEQQRVETEAVEHGERIARQFLFIVMVS